MAVKIIILRRVNKEQEEAMRPLLLKMRSMAMTQPGYISGETLINFDDPEEHLVISTWKTLDDWNKWLESPARGDLQHKVDEALGRETLYQIYYNG
ncbi:MAG: antibiotic biosynthesis monooxygenase [SAR324 cluster bacterium]|nr:antibiotic biosynthesis monooxygenase [SAR324 cluster bacterium]MBF0352490.1 antibiotic biosynthesis monooxygenase [SAR324 cluster bacterium]